MTFSLPAQASLTHLKKQAKTLLQQYRQEKSNKAAIKVITEYHPKPSEFSGLRDAQLVIARQYGYQDWATLKQAIEQQQMANKTLAEQAEEFVRLACIHYNGDDNAVFVQRAKQLLKWNQQIGEYDLYAAIVANNLVAVRKFLEQDNSLINKMGGPLGWVPLHYLTYSRIDEEDHQKQSIAILKLLLEEGADANSYRLLNEQYYFTALTGAIGEGEASSRHQPPHQYAQEVAMLLLEAGANPNDSQALYNTLFEYTQLDWVKLLITHGLNARHTLNWSKDENAQTCFDFLVSFAARHGMTERVTFFLDHGADPNAVSVYNQRTAYANAMVMGRPDLAEYLLKRGAKAEPLNTKDQLLSAISSRNQKSIQSLLLEAPELIKDAEFLHHAAQGAGLETVLYLISKGFDVNGLSHDGRTIVHIYAWEGNAKAISALLEIGANPDIKDSTHQSTPLGFAIYAKSSEVIQLLTDHSDNIIEVVACENVERAKVLLEDQPDLINKRSNNGQSLLHIIGFNLQSHGNDMDACEKLLDLLLSRGLDINNLSDDNQTPLAFAKAQANQLMVDLLESRGG